MTILSFIKIAITTFVLTIAIDYLWVGVFMHKFYDTALGNLARRVDGVMTAHVPSVIAVYIALAIGITYFVIQPNPNASLFQIALIGALLGFVVYGVYDFTNYAVLSNYGVKLLIIDIIWGTFLCGFISVLVKMISTRFL